MRNLSLRPRTLRARLALVFTLVTVIVSAAVSGFVLLRHQSEVSNAISDGLETRFADVSAAVGHAAPPSPGSELDIIPKAEVFAQVLRPDGTIIAASPRALAERPVLSRAQLRKASHRRTVVERPVPPRADTARLLSGPGRLRGERVVIVVGSSLDESTRAQHQLETALAIAVPVLALVVIGAGWLLVSAALRPVGAMVSEAGAFSERARGKRLTEPPTAELAELARRLNDMLSRIEAAADHERAFLDDASHELRTPIAIARGELELALPLVADDAPSRAAIESALDEVQRLENLATNLVVLARMRAAGPPADTPLDLRQVCDGAVEDVRRGADLGTPEISVDGHAQTRGDASALRRAVGNLVDNAVRHASHQVNVSVGIRDGRSIVEVRDDGPGFPRAIATRAKERYVGSPGGGAGLGLAIVDAIATAHGGSLDLTAATGDGATVVRLWLPAAG